MPKGKTPKEKGIEKRELNKEIQYLISITDSHKLSTIDLTFLRYKDMKILKKKLEELSVQQSD